MLVDEEQSGQPQVRIRRGFLLFVNTRHRIDVAVVGGFAVSIDGSVGAVVVVVVVVVDVE
ncbi:hypothetical protein ColTof4_05939 [Colletotrichum tofieldiae]|nr:hypothetical protein ColTof3_01115 [Colletotrichum tofieldiae]GKT73516.1 hypothetical protein ColTof4_05939 [Colletotrichum tofieldiae]GKT95457.1 hypothetical protein Ct61P_13307 [Colletotrichum tofieldiae]